MVYEWRKGSRIRADAAQAAQVMQRLADADQLNAQALVEVSRPTDAPLHGSFEWDDTAAASEWRKHQARHIMGSLVVRTEDSTEEPVRMFVQIASKGSDYQPLELVMRQRDTRQELLDQALGELTAFRAKYAALTELARVFRAIEETENGGGDTHD